MKALYQRQITGKGACINISMFESSVSWMTTAITLTTLQKEPITRTGNSHAFFCPVNVYKTKNGFVYVAIGNDRQWKSLVSLEMFEHLDKPEYDKNNGRKKDAKTINHAINGVTSKLTSEELIELFSPLTLPISKINTIPDVIADPLVQKRLLRAKDQKTGIEITLTVPPNMTLYLESVDRRLSFPPRFGEHNREIYGKILGYSDEDLARLEEKKVI